MEKRALPFRAPCDSGLSGGVDGGIAGRGDEMVTRGRSGDMGGTGLRLGGSPEVGAGGGALLVWGTPSKDMLRRMWLRGKRGRA
jgi:hypothetical protein